MKPLANLPSLLDERGILRRPALASPPRGAAYTVFAQRADARIELSQWTRHGAQFFGTRIEIPTPKRYRGAAPEEDATDVVVTPPHAPSTVRLIYGRPRTEDDLRAAVDADVRAGFAGLSALAERCRYVWLVVRDADDDPCALLLAAVVASVVLGPILTPNGAELIGVTTARLALEASGTLP